MTRRIKNVPIEVAFTAAMVVVMMALSIWFALPVSMPAIDSAAFIGVHYLLPLIGLLAWIMCAAVGQRRDLSTVLFGLPCYAIVLWVHFNLKLWVPLINPSNFDGLYWTFDGSMRPLVDGAIYIRKAVSPAIPFQSNLYMYAFIFMFYASFCYHAVATPKAFRPLFLAALFLQGLGAFSYIIFPASGPFIYEPGANPFVSETQRFMLDARGELIQGGASWLSSSGSEYFAAGLGAMPSLHAAASSLFVWFAYKHAKPLLPIYLTIFAYILVVAVANRWHYLIDLPAGVALAAGAIYLAKLATSPDQRQVAEDDHVQLLIGGAAVYS